MYVIERTEIFIDWLRGIKDSMAVKKIAARIERAGLGNFGDWKPVGGEVREMRIDHGGGYRIYYTIRDNKIVLLLCGGGKKSQDANIKKAQKIAEEL